MKIKVIKDDVFEAKGSGFDEVLSYSGVLNLIASYKKEDKYIVFLKDAADAYKNRNKSKKKSFKPSLDVTDGFSSKKSGVKSNGSSKD